MSVGAGLAFFGIAMTVSAALGCYAAEAPGVLPPVHHQNNCDSLAVSGTAPSGACRAADAPLRIAASPTAAPAPAEAVNVATLTPRNLQSFVKTWQPADKPLCKLMRSNADWQQWMGAAAVMGPHKPYAPPASLWSQHVVVLIARVVGASDPGTVFELTGVSNDRESLVIAYHLRTSSPASYKIAAWTGVVLGNGQLRQRIEIIEDGAMICSIDNRHKTNSLSVRPESRHGESEAPFGAGRR